MVDINIPQYAAFLRGHYLFKSMDEAQIAHVVTRIKRVETKENEVVVSDGVNEDGFYIVFQGRLGVSRTEGSRQLQQVIYGPGEYFGEEALLFDRQHDNTVTAIEPAVLLHLEREDFIELIHDFPQVRSHLSATAESRYLAQKADFNWVGEDEVVYLITRKHEIFLITSLLIPILIGVGSIPVILFGFSFEPSAFSNIAMILGVIGLLFSFLFSVWRWIDWGNDYYIVTNQRVVGLERVLIFYFSRREAPLTQVLAVNVTRSWLGRKLNFGDVEVRTFTGGILMRNAAHPKQLAHFVEGFKTRARELMNQVETEEMERAIRQRLGLEVDDISLPESPEIPIDWESEDQPKSDSWLDMLETFLRVRYERDGVITYRKHWLLLVRKVWFPSLLFTLLLGVTLYLLWTGTTSGSSLIFGFPGLCLVGFLYIVTASWWVYNYIDWSNDIYQLTSDKILDIERKPLGAENKKTAPLDSILSLEHTRLGLLQQILNYGDVKIMVGQTPFVFRGVYNPDDVHQDVANYIEARQRKEHREEVERERERMVDALVSYQEQSEIAEGFENESDWDLFPG